jgi:hypothetical protein
VVLFGLLQSVRFVEGTTSEIALTATDRRIGTEFSLDQVAVRLVRAPAHRP